MKLKHIHWTGLLLLLLASCGGKEQQPETQPAIRVELESVSGESASFSVQAVGCYRIAYGTDIVASHSVPVPSTGPERLSITLDGLTPGTSYTLRAYGIGEGGVEGARVELPFDTQAQASDLYDWEKGRTPLPYPADMTLIPGPSSHRSPLGWDKERWLSHVAYTDEKGQEHWLFDSFLLIEGQQNGKYGSPIITFSVTDDDRPSGTKADWQHVLDFWFKGGAFDWQESFWGDGKTTFGRWYTGNTQTLNFSQGQLDNLDACIAEVAGRIGEPPHKRYIVMALPEPIYFDNYIRGVRGEGGSTTYWGALKGRNLDFSSAEDRIQAYVWFMDQTRKAFQQKNYRHIELLGFYILPEVLSTTWRAKYKQYDVVIPAVAAYAHSCNEALYWIPYNMAEGYKKWEDFGFDIAYMQPNYYWEPDEKPMAATFAEIDKYKMGLELEFEYSMVENVNGAASARTYRERFEQYLEWARNSGVYGKRSIALYSGTDALHQLAASPLEGDRETYHQLGHFLIESPLKK